MSQRSINKNDGAGTNPARPPKKSETKESDTAESTFQSNILTLADHPSFS